MQMAQKDILAEFAALGVELWEDAGRLRYRVRKGQTADDLPARIAEKLPQILAAVRARRKSGEAVGQALAANPEHSHEPFPVTPLQSAYLLGREGAFELGNISCQAYFEFEGEHLSAQRLAEAWQSLIQRHAMLRCVFTEEGGQRILRDVPPYAIETLDLRALAQEQRERALAALRESMSGRVMTPAAWPLFDLRLVLIEGEKARFLISIDMLIADFFSIRILFRELFTLYNAPQQALAPLAASFRDYVMATTGMTSSLPYQRARAYWAKLLPTLPPAPMLPLAAKGASLAAPVFDRLGDTLSPEDWSALQQHARLHSVTPSTALLAAYAEVLGVWSNQKHFTLNLTILNRLPLHPDIMHVVGDFTSVELLEVDMREPAPFARRAADIQARLWQDLEHRHFDGVNVLRELSSGREERVFMPVVFTSTIGMGSSEEDVPKGFGVSNMVYSITQAPQVWLDFQTGELNGALLLAWDHVRGLFPEDMLEAMFARFIRRVRELAHESSAWEKAGTACTPPSAQLAVRATINSTESTMPRCLLHSLFEERASQNPDHIAVRTGPVRLTYGELAQQANALAALLREKGVERGGRVAVVMEKGWEQIVAVLAVLKAGAAYLPIAPAVPDLRLRHLVQHGKVSLILTQTRLLQRMPESTPCIAVDALPPRQASAVASGTMPEDLAYVIYTSGSTGEPKGVMISHASAVNTLVDINRRFSIGPDDVVFGLSSLNFDLSVYDIFGTLAAGATLLLPEAGKEKESGYWLRLLRQERVTVWNSVPAFMEMLVQEAQAEDEALFRGMPVRLALLSGDYVSPELVRKVHSLFRSVTCVSLGGATEASIWSIVHPILPEDLDAGVIPYGRPLANQRFYVLNTDMAPCPDWVVGELYIAGDGLASGYWADEEKTRTAFPFHPVTGERLYRTGDLGFCRPDGEIMFCGRRDTQVKIHGRRIELGEIEAAMRQYPGVLDAVAAVSEGAGSGRQIAAYIVREDAPKRPSPEAGAGKAFEALAAGARRAGKSAQKTLSAADVADFDRRVHNSVVRELARVCRASGLVPQAGEAASPVALMERGGVLPEFLPLVRQWFALLSQEGWLKAEGGELFSGVRPFSDDDPEPPAPDGKGEGGPLFSHVNHVAKILQTCRERSRDILTGAVEAAAVFWGESPLSPGALNRAMPGAAEIADILGSALRAFVHAMDGPARVLEVGAGSAATTRTLLHGLGPDRIRCTVSATSPFFMEALHKELEGMPGLHCTVFNMERQPEAQGLSAGGFDLIVGINSFHRARNIPEFLGRLRTLLAPGGALLFSEGLVNTSLQLLTTGFLERGFGDLADVRAGTNAPLLPAGQWEDMLRQAGFVAAEACPTPESGGPGIGQAVFFARMPDVSAFSESNKLDAFLRQRLPDYMIPVGYACIDKIPLSPNGKVDRNSLPPCTGAAVAKRPKALPVTPTERLLAEIWGQIMKREHVDINEDFFAMGGDSLTANMLAVQLKKRTGMRIPLRAVFEKSTIFMLGQYIDSNGHLFAQEPVLEEGAI